MTVLADDAAATTSATESFDCVDAVTDVDGVVWSRVMEAKNSGLGVIVVLGPEVDVAGVAPGGGVGGGDVCGDGSNVICFLNSSLAACIRPIFSSLFSILLGGGGRSCCPEETPNSLVTV